MRYLYTIILLFYSTLVTAEDKIITLASDIWCPWSCDAKNQGIAVELAQAIFEPLGYKVNFKIMPWTRAVKEATDGHITGIIGADHFTDNTSKFIFPQIALNVSDAAYAVAADSDFIYKDHASLAGKKIGVTSDYHFNCDLGRYIEQHYNNPDIIDLTWGEKSAIYNLNKLAHGKIDLYVDNGFVLKQMAKRLGLEKDIKIVDYINDQNSIYIAFSPSLLQSSSLAQIYDRGMKRIMENGHYQQILAKYGIISSALQ